MVQLTGKSWRATVCVVFATALAGMLFFAGKAGFWHRTVHYRSGSAMLKMVSRHCYHGTGSIIVCTI